MTFFLVLLWTVYACRFVWRSVWRFAGSSALQVALFMVRSVGGRPGWTASTLGAATMVSGRPGARKRQRSLPSCTTRTGGVSRASCWSVEGRSRSPRSKTPRGHACLGSSSTHPFTRRHGRAEDTDASFAVDRCAFPRGLLTPR